MPTIPTSTRNVQTDATVDLIDAGAGAGTVEIHTAAFATLLATLTFSDPAFGASATGTATASAITDDTSADATGTAAVFRVKDSDANVVFEGTVSTSGADMNFNTVAFVATANVSITSFTFTSSAS